MWNERVDEIKYFYAFENIPSISFAILHFVAALMDG